jgi:hypothetical protein
VLTPVNHVIGTTTGEEIVGGTTTVVGTDTIDDVGTTTIFVDGTGAITIVGTNVGTFSYEIMTAVGSSGMVM